MGRIAPKGYFQARWPVRPGLLGLLGTLLWALKVQSHGKKTNQDSWSPWEQSHTFPYHSSQFPKQRNKHSPINPGVSFRKQLSILAPTTFSEKGGLGSQSCLCFCYPQQHFSLGPLRPQTPPLVRSQMLAFVWRPPSILPALSLPYSCWASWLFLSTLLVPPPPPNSPNPSPAWFLFIEPIHILI